MLVLVGVSISYFLFPVFRIVFLWYVVLSIKYGLRTLVLAIRCQASYLWYVVLSILYGLRTLVLAIRCQASYLWYIVCSILYSVFRI